MKPLCLICDEPTILDEWKTFTAELIEGCLKMFRLCENHVDEVRDIYFEQVK